MKAKIGIFDSGLGGLSILKELIKELPNEEYIYYGDSINNPYGNKNVTELQKIVDNVVKKLIDYGCNIIVVACNTATTMCINYLKTKYKDIVFIGTVPAIKVACDNNYKKIALLSTPNTMTSSRVGELINDNISDSQKIENISGDNLAKLIENDDIVAIKKLLKEKFSNYNDCDCIVLGCTHYSLIKDIINNIMPKAALIDGASGVAREVKRQMAENGLVSNGKLALKIYNSKSDELINRSYEILGGYYENKKC